MNTLKNVRRPPCNVTLGMEIECLLPYESYREATETYVGFWYGGYDGSISRDNWDVRGIEFVSQPLTPNFLRKELRKLYTKFPTMTTNPSCGIHIHISRKWLSTKRGVRIQKFLCSISRESFKRFFGRTPNDYCLQADMDTRYCVVNTTNTATIEIRGFASGGHEWAQYCVQATEWLIHNAGFLSEDRLNTFCDMFPHLCG